MVFALILLLAGTGFLFHGARFMVHGASTLAYRLRVPSLFVGLTVVAFGTSAPELLVALRSAAEGLPYLTVGNILGANVVNILLILGLAASLGGLTLKRDGLVRDLPLLLVATVLVAYLGGSWSTAVGREHVLSRTDGVVMLVVFGLFFLSLLLGRARDGQRIIDHFRIANGTITALVGARRVWLAVLELVAAAVLLYLGGEAFVRGATSFGRIVGLSEEAVGLSVAALGTTVPELMTTLVAVVRRQRDIAIGNALGSNLFNLLFVLGTTATVYGLPWSNAFLPDVWVNLAALGLLAFVAFRGRRRGHISRAEGRVMLGSYAAYFLYLIVRFSP